MVLAHKRECVSSNKRWTGREIPMRHVTAIRIVRFKLGPRQSLKGVLDVHYEPQWARYRLTQGLHWLCAAALIAAMWLALNAGRSAQAQSCTSNPIVCENAKPGNPPSDWDIVGAGDPSIQGFATAISVNLGET